METNPILLKRKLRKANLTIPDTIVAGTLVVLAALSLVFFLGRMNIELNLAYAMVASFLFLSILAIKLIRVGAGIQTQLHNLSEQYISMQLAMTGRVPDTAPMRAVSRSRFLVKKGQDWLVIPVGDIAWVKVHGKFCLIKTWDSKRHILDFTLEEITGMLDPENFLRVNRSYLINFRALRSISPYLGGKLLLNIQPEADNEKVVVSKERAMEVKKWLGFGK